MSFAYVAAPGISPVEFVLMIFPTAQSAVDHLTGLGLVATQKEPLIFSRVQREDGTRVNLSAALEEECVDDDCEDDHDEDDFTPRARALINALFRSAYGTGGYYCTSHGECESLIVREAGYGQPLHAFDMQ